LQGSAIDAVNRKEDSTLRKVIILAAALGALCLPDTGHSGEDAAPTRSGDILSVGFQFSVTDPQGPSKLTDVAGSGPQFRAFYEIVNLSKRWRFVGEFGYNTFGIREDEYLPPVGRALEDSINASFPLGSDYPEGSVATLEEISIKGGDFNAMHVTVGAKYMVLPDEQSFLRPYVTAQAGYYSVGQSDSDISASFNVERPGMSDIVLVVPSTPWTRDVERDGAFGFSVGGGAEMRVIGGLALLADLRYHAAYTEETTTFLDVGAGIAYYLGF
jgi:hypothetical protein